MPDTVLAESSEARSRQFLADITRGLPGIRARAGETEQLGRVPDDTIQELTDIGVFRATQPRQWGGLEIDHATFYEGMALIASACASTGWVASVVGIHPWQVALFADAAQRDVWAEDRDARIASSLAPTGAVRRVDGGYRLSGRWPFSSGVDHCSWALIGGVIPDGDGEFRTFLVPRGDFTIDQGSWQVTGLAGTGSKDLLIEDAFVPEHRTHSVVDVYHGRDPGFAVNDRPYFRLPWRLVFGYTIAAPAIGAALGAVEAFIDSNRARVSAYGGPPVARDPAVNRPLARALVETGSARMRLAATWRELRATLDAGETIPFPRRVQALYEAALAHHACTDAVCALVAVNGGRTMRADGVLQRGFRDLLAMRNHPAANLEFSGTLYAQAMLGLAPPQFVPSQRFVF